LTTIRCQQYAYGSIGSFEEIEEAPPVPSHDVIVHCRKVVTRLGSAKPGQSSNGGQKPRLAAGEGVLR